MPVHFPEKAPNTLPPNTGTPSLGVERNDDMVPFLDDIFFTEEPTEAPPSPSRPLSQRNVTVQLGNAREMSSEEFRAALQNGEDLGSQPIVVTGTLYFPKGTNLKALPDNLVVKGAIYINGIENLEKLPDNLQVEGDLYITDCPHLKKLPANLCVKGHLVLERNTNFEEVSTGLHVTGDLSIIGCKAFTKLPNDLFVGMWASVGHSKSQPSGLARMELELEPEEPDTDPTVQIGFQFSSRVMGCLTVSDRSIRLKNLPDNFHVRGCLMIVGNWLKALPTKLYVGRELDISYCESLTTLPPDLYLGKFLTVTRCPNLTIFPDHFQLIEPPKNQNDEDETKPRPFCRNVSVPEQVYRYIVTN